MVPNVGRSLFGSSKILLDVCSYYECKLLETALVWMKEMNFTPIFTFEVVIYLNCFFKMALGVGLY